MKRVVVTGVGAVTPIGNNVDEFWNGIKENKCGIGPITRFDASEYKVSVAAELKDFNPETIIPKRELKRLDRFSQYAIVAADEALKDSGIEITDENAMRIGTIMGTGIGGFETIENGYQRLLDKGPRRLNPMFIPMIISNMGAANVAIKTGARGASYSLNTACAAGTNAIGEAFLKIATGMLDGAFVGGSEASVVPLAMGSFDALTALSSNEDPTKASRPFDKDRDGFVAGEGAGVLYIESLESAQARGAKIYAEIVGYGTNSDAYHITAPRPDGEGAAEAMRDAMNMAGVKPEEIDYINAHGTSTPTNDTAETESIKRALGDAAYQTAISSTKGHTGHLLGAAGGIEAVVLAKAIEEGYIPATLGLETPGEGLDLDYVPGQGREAEIRYAMSNSLGFGGHNATILFKRWDGA
ncbi:beta-ketoacyl-ACP synthase II [Aerococcaceae bacterium DSM 111022]|nr:beta-ketoacyl-ACP synthase II [Aerococcaceae bacterium DSM 111022]